MFSKNKTSAKSKKSGQTKKTPVKTKTAVKNAPKTNNSQSQLTGAIKSDIASLAKQKVGKLYTQLGDKSGHQTSEQKTLTGRHLIDRMSKIGVDLGRTSLISPGVGKEISSTGEGIADYTVAYYLEEIVKQADASGFGVVFDVVPGSNGKNNISVGFYNKAEQDEDNLDLSKVAKIEIGLIDDVEMTKGGVPLVNSLMPTVEFKEDYKGNKVANTVLSSGVEQQLKGILRLVSSKTGEEGEEIGPDNTFVRRMMQQDYEGAASVASYVAGQSFASSPSGASNNITKELQLQAGLRTPESKIGLSNRVNFNGLIQQIYSNKKIKDYVNQIYQERAKAKGYKTSKTVNPYELTDEERKAVMLGISLIA